MAAPLPRNGKILGCPILSHPYAALCHGVAPAAIHDFKTHLRERAICDERISLPLSAFEELDTVYSKLAAQFGTQEAMVEVKVNWRSPM